MRSVGAFVTAIGLWLASAAFAAEDSGVGDVSDIHVIRTAVISGSYVAAGYSNLGGFLNAHVEVINLASGAIIWSNVAEPGSIYTDVVASAGKLYLARVKPDDDGDPGLNLSVSARNLFDGRLLWQRELEAPDPDESFAPSVFPARLAVAGTNVVVRAYHTTPDLPGVASVVLRLNGANGKIVLP